MRIDLPVYAPDQSINSGVLTVAENVEPAADGYRPIRDIVTSGDALAETFNGGGSFKSEDGTAYLLAGTSTKLYRWSSGSWVELLTGLTTSSRWKFVSFGNFVIGVNGGTTQVVNLAAGTAGVLAGAPTGTDITVVGDYVVITGADGNKKMVQWSAFNDHTEWTPGVNQAGFQPMLTGDEIMGIAGGEFGVILQRTRLVRMSRTGNADAPFQFDEITPNVGCASRGSISYAGRSVFFRSDRGFMSCEDGQLPVPFGNEIIDKTFASEVPRDEWERLYCTIDPERSVARWCLPGSPGKQWLYNWSLQRFGIAKYPFEAVFSGFTSSTDADNTGIANIDADTRTTDDPGFSGGNPSLYVIKDGKLGTESGPTLQAVLWLGFKRLPSALVQRLNSLFLEGDMTAATVVLDHRQRLGDPENLKTADSMRPSGRIPIRVAGKYIATRVKIAAGHVWSIFQAIEFVGQEGGER